MEHPWQSKEIIFYQVITLNGNLVMMLSEKMSRSLLNHHCHKLNLLEQTKKTKSLYELSEYIWYFHKWNIVTKEELDNIAAYLNSIPKSSLIDHNSNLQINRSHPIKNNINGFDFEYTQVKYPLLIYKFSGYQLITEIKITEKQYAVGIQPMLYFCFPITELKSKII